MMWVFAVILIKMIKSPSKRLNKLIYVPMNGGFVLVQARGMFMVSFDKETSKNIFEKCTVSVDLSKTGKVLPILTIKALFELIAYDSNPKPSLSNFSRLYHNFVINPANSEYILDQKHITFGKGGYKKASLNGDGLKLFIKKNQEYFQVSLETLVSFTDAVLKGFINVVDPTVKKLLLKRVLPAQIDLYEDNLICDMRENPSLNSYNYLHTELQELLVTRNTFYIMECENLFFRVGHTLDTLRGRLQPHPVYNSPRFKSFHTLFKFKDSELLDSVTLENDFFLKCYVIGLQKHEIERCSFTNDFCFKVDDIRDIQNMLNLCLTNPHINYSGIAEPVTNKGLLNALAECKNYNYDIFKKFK